VGVSYVTFERNNDALFGLAAAVGDRLHVEPRLRLPLSAPWGFLTFSGGLRHTRYDLRDMPAGLDEQPERNIGLGSVHGGLFFERDLTAFGTPLVQTLEPQLYYLYQAYADQDALPRFDASDLTFSYSQLFRDNRFSGLDRIGDANQLSVGLTSRFVNTENGREYFRASIGVIDYFRDRRVTLTGLAGEQEEQPTSAIAGELSAGLARAWRGTGSVVWDPNDNEVDEVGAALQYRPDGRHILNLGYRKRTEGDINQTDLSLYWPISRHYAVMGRWNYDVVSGRTVEGFGGIEYNDCCWRIRLMARRFLDSPTGSYLDAVEPDDGIFLQIVFKGLAGFGDKMESVLQRGIRGYSTETRDGIQ
jgi:LPS-assembly protein